MRDLRRRAPVAALALGAVLLAAGPGRARGQQVIYVNNDVATTNTVSALAVNAVDGSLKPLPGSPFATGGGGSFAPNINGINVLALSGFLYATNTVSNSVSAFRINDDGTLTTIPGSPFPTLGTRPNGIAASNDGSLLFVTNTLSGTVSVFQVASNGAITLAAGSPLAVAAQPLGVVLDSPDSLMFVSQSGINAVGVYTVGIGGTSLTAIGGSPFAAAGGERGLDVNAAHSLLYVADGSNNTVSGFTIGAGGTLAAVAGSPFAAGSEPTGVLFHPSLSVLYVANDVSNDIDGYSFDGSGVLSAIQNVASGGNGTAGMLIDSANSRLYAVNGGTSASASRDVSVYDIAPTTGLLTAIAGSPFPTGASAGRPSAVALVTIARADCTATAPGSCSPGGGFPGGDCVAEWLVLTNPPPPLKVTTNLPGTRATCQNGNPACDYDGDATDDHCTFHLQVCLNNVDPRLPCPATDVASFELKRPKPGKSTNDSWDLANIKAFQKAISGNSCDNEPQTRSCLTDADCQAGGTCVNPPIVGVPFVQGKTPIIPPAPTPTPPPNSATDVCSNVMEIQVPLRSNSTGIHPRSKSFWMRVLTSGKVIDGDTLRLTCVPAS